jgi:hypothetical protein
MRLLGALRLTAFAVPLLVLTPALARAESAVVLVAERGDAEELAAARGGVIEALAERGIRLVRAPDGEPCAEAACAAQIAGTTGADFVAIVELETVRLEAGGERQQVRVHVVRAEGAPHDAVVIAGAGGCGVAASAALAEALERAGQTRMGFLLVRTRPSGAAVEIDGEPAGESPLRRMVSAGEHRVRVVREGGEPREQSVEVAAREETALEIDLEAEQENAPIPTHTRSEASPLNWIIGGALAIGGVVVLISPLQTIATEGECVDLIEGVGCVERVHFGVQSGILLGVGLALLAAAVIVDVVAPIRVEVAASSGSAMLRLSGRF